MNARYALAALAAMTLTAGPALAQPAAADGSARMAVSYADLNLNTAAGQAVLMGRIRHAAEQVCGPEPDSHDLKTRLAFKACLRQSVDTAVSAIPEASRLAGAVRPAG